VEIDTSDPIPHNRRMGFYDESDKVDLYEQMCVDYDGTVIHEALGRHLDAGQSLLEIGCGPGNDMELFRRKYGVVGSDTSHEFLARCRKRFPAIEFVELDAVTIDTDRQFDCLFSNKVLHHLGLDDLVFSFKRQTQVISTGGLFAHTFWIGGYEEEKHGLYFRYHDRDELIRIISEYFQVVDLVDYAEFEDGDSLLVIARNGQANSETVVMR